MILALAFLVAVSLVVIGIVRWAGNNLSNTSKFVAAQSVQSAANSATQFAIQFDQYNFLNSGLDGAAAQPCWTSSSTPSQTQINNQTVDSWCMTREYDGLNPPQRVVTISTCTNSVTTGSACESQPLLQAIITYVDGSGACSPVSSVSSAQNTCGLSATISDWQFGATPPTVSGFAPGGFSCPVGVLGSTGIPVVVNGQNLSLATNVDFVTQSSASDPTHPAMDPGTVVSSTATSVNACAPSAGPYYVIVSTPLGSNQYGPTSLWSSG
ncbi:MAG TPA: hypothetical protein VND83_05175 [Acidimicrobiales bacterium]|nr:hypothetical protein [Acidimicrobiales bacterium]